MEPLPEPGIPDGEFSCLVVGRCCHIVTYQSDRLSSFLEFDLLKS